MIIEHMHYWPVVTWLVMVLVGFGIELNKSGEKFIINFILTIFGTTLFYFGNFFAPIGFPAAF